MLIQLQKNPKIVPVVIFTTHYDSKLTPKQYARKKNLENYDRSERYDFD